MAKVKKVLTDGVFQYLTPVSSVGGLGTFSNPIDPMAAYNAWVARLSVAPSAGQALIYQALFKELQAVWHLLDALWLHAMHDETSSWQNLVSSKYTLTKVGSGLTWSSTDGYTATTSTSDTDYLSTGYVPSDLTDGKVCRKDSISMGCFSPTTGSVIGTINVVAPAADVNFRGAAATRMMNNSTDVYGAISSDGHFGLSYFMKGPRKRSIKTRNGKCYNSRDNDFLLDFATYADLPNVEYTIMRTNAGSSKMNGVVGTKSLYSWCGAGLTETELDIVACALDRYLNKIGYSTGYARSVGVRVS